MDKEDYELCYIDENKAWFTDSFEHQWGDDWNDKPYEHNAGEPYDEWHDDDHKPHKINLVSCYFELPRFWNFTPCDKFQYNSPYSVEDINKGAIAWIHTDKFNIQAKTKFKDFKDIIKKNDGKIYVEI